jgi:hypothetical protein
MIGQNSCNLPTRAALWHPLLLLVAGLISWPAEWDYVHTWLDSARSPESNSSEHEPHALGYYVELIEGSSGSRAIAQPAGWVGFREADVIRYLEDDFLLFELRPEIRRTLGFGLPFRTNAYGMHGDPVAREKPPQTFRIAVLGASMDMGWGVRYEETYVHRLQEWLDSRTGAGQPGQSRRYEVLNFAVAAYSPLQRLETLRRKVLDFRPDLVVYSATTLDVRLMEIHLCDLLRKRIDLKYDFVREALGRTTIGPADLRLDRSGELIHKHRIKEKLARCYWSLYDRTLGAIAAECRAAGVPLAMVIIPRVGAQDAPRLRAEPVARLKALASHHAITTYDLSDTFDRDDPRTLEIAAWDDHPNATGHGRLFEAIARSIAADPTLAPLVLSARPTPPAEAAPRERAVEDRPESPVVDSTRPGPTLGGSG